MRLQRFFVSGLLVLLPIAVTIYVLVWVYSFSDRIISAVLGAFGLAVSPGLQPFMPVLGLILTLALVVLVGALAGNYLGRVLLGALDRAMKSVPLVRDVYKAVQQIAQTLLGQPEMQFSRAALIEYPRKGLYTLCFVASPNVGRKLPPLPDGFTVVLVPTSPVPASGMAIIVPTADVIPLDIPVEDALRYVVSGGFILPDGRVSKPLQEMSNN